MPDETVDRLASAGALVALLAALVASSAADMKTRAGPGLAPEDGAFGLAWSVIFPLSAAALTILAFDPVDNSWRALAAVDLAWSCCALWAVAFTHRLTQLAALLLLLAVGAASAGCAFVEFGFDRGGLLVNAPISLLGGWLLWAAAIGVATAVDDAHGRSPGPLARRRATVALCVLAAAFAAAAKSPLFALPSLLPVFMRRDSVAAWENAACAGALAGGTAVAFARTA